MDIRFHEKLYRDGISDRKLKRIRRKVSRGTAKLNLFFITLPLGENGLLEIYWYPELLQKAYRELDKTLVVVGIADSREDAFYRIEEIVEDVGWETGDIPITHFFEEQP